MTGLRTALALFTALPVPHRWHDEFDAATAPRALYWLPLTGALLGAIAGGVGAGAVTASGSPLLGATLTVAVLALLTRGLHLDGLADLADGLGSRKPAAEALAIMKQSDIGAFGIVVLVLALVVDVAALGSLDTAWMLLVAAVIAAMTGRLAVLYACQAGTPSARPDGFGSLVAGRAKVVPTLLVTDAVLVVAGASAYAVDAPIVWWLAAQLVALALVWFVQAHAVRRLGGVTGDVFGALIELTTAFTLIGLAVTASG